MDTFKPAGSYSTTITIDNNGQEEAQEQRPFLKPLDNQYARQKLKTTHYRLNQYLSLISHPQSNDSSGQSKALTYDKIVPSDNIIDKTFARLGTQLSNLIHYSSPGKTNDLALAMLKILAPLTNYKNIRYLASLIAKQYQSNIGNKGATIALNNLNQIANLMISTDSDEALDNSSNNEKAIIVSNLIGTIFDLTMNFLYADFLLFPELPDEVKMRICDSAKNLNSTCKFFIGWRIQSSLSIGGWQAEAYYRINQLGNIPLLMERIRAVKYLKISASSSKELSSACFWFFHITHLDLSSTTLTDFSSNRTDSSYPLFRSLLELRTLKISNCKKLTDAGLKDVACAEQLTDLDLSTSENFTRDGFAALQKLINLTKLNLSGVKNFKDSNLVGLSRLHQLRILNLDGCSIDGSGLKFLHKAKKIEEISMNNCVDLKDGYLLSLKACDNLKKVSMAGCSSLAGKSKDSDAKDLTLLCDYFYTEVGTGIGLSTIALKNIQSINLNGCINLTDIIFDGLKKNSSLTDLGLGSCKKLTEKGLANIKYLTNLESLDLSDHDNVTDQFVELLLGIARLRDLNLKNCNNLTEDSVISLSQIPELVFTLSGKKIEQVA